jgi:hypothetical protein
MRELHVEGVATHDDPEPCVGAREGAGEAWDRGTCGPGIEPRNQASSGRRRRYPKRKATRTESTSRESVRPCAVEDPVHVRNLSVREPGDLRSARRDGVAAGRVGKAEAMSRR